MLFCWCLRTNRTSRMPYQSPNSQRNSASMISATKPGTLSQPAPPLATGCTKDLTGYPKNSPRTNKRLAGQKRARETEHHRTGEKARTSIKKHLVFQHRCSKKDEAGGRYNHLLGNFTITYFLFSYQYSYYIIFFIFYFSHFVPKLLHGNKLESSCTMSKWCNRETSWKQ